jgi:hypothetical protein
MGPSLLRNAFTNNASNASGLPGFAPLPQGSRSPAAAVGSKPEPTARESQDATRGSRRLAQR